MNVRFFAGTKADYLSLPTPRNPLGLYFCEDTKELFWADRLLTDGIRVVPTFADLPKRAEAAAEGVVYYVTETRNGYVLSPDRSEWLQTIYAPATDAYKVPETEVYNTVTTVGAVRDIEAKIYKTIDERIANIEIGTTGPGVKAIYFAGRKLDAHDDGTYHIDRLCALDALGFKIPEGQEDAEIELVTKEYVDKLLAKIPGSDIDLSDYVKQEDLVDFATKEFVQTKIAEAELADQDVDLSAYYTKSETEAAIKSAVDAIEIPEVPTKVSELENDAKYVTEEYVDNAISAIEIPTIIHLTSLFESANAVVEDITLLRVLNLLQQNKEVALYINGVPLKIFVGGDNNHNISLTPVDYTIGGNYVDVDSDGNTDLASASFKQVSYSYYFDGTTWRYASRNPLDSILFDNLPTKHYVDNAIAKIPETDLSNYYNKTETENLIAEAVESVEHPTVDLEGYATEEWVNEQGFLKEHQDLSDYAKKSDLPSVEGLASESYVDEKIAEINIPDTSTFVTNEQFTSIQQQVENIQNTYITEEHLEQKNYVTEQFVTNNYVTNETIEANYSTTEEIAQTYVSNNDVNEIVTNQVTEVINQKIEDGNLVVNADAINYDTW